MGPHFLHLVSVFATTINRHQYARRTVRRAVFVARCARAGRRTAAPPRRALTSCGHGAVGDVSLVSLALLRSNHVLISNLALGDR